MKIGYCVEGSTDRAMLEGLRKRWCPGAEMIEGRFRGEFRRREIPKACLELQFKGADLIIMLRDANDEDWRDVLDGDRNCCSSKHEYLAVFAACDRNIECWLTADRQYTATKTGVPPETFRVADPKGIFERAMGITSLDRKEDEIAKYTCEAPLHNWLPNKSFEHFYESLRDKSKQMNCGIENIRDF